MTTPTNPTDPADPLGPQAEAGSTSSPAPFAAPGGDPTPAPPASPGGAGWGAPTTDIGYGAPRYGQYAPGYTPVPPPSQPVAPSPGQPLPQGQHPPYPQPGPSSAPQYGGQQYGGQQYGAPQHQPQYQQAPPGYGGPGWRPMAAKPGIIPLRPLSLGEIYDGAFAAIRKNPKVMLGLVALVITVATIIPAIINYFVAPSVNRWLDDELSALESSSSTSTLTVDIGLDGLGGQLSLNLLISVGMYFASIITTGLLIAAVSKAVINKPFTAADVWAQVRGKIGGLVVISLAPAVIMFVAAFGLFFAAASVGGDAGVGLVLLTAVVVVAAAFWLSVRFLLTPAAYVLEGQGLWSSIKRGWLVSRGSFWRLLGIYLLSSIITGIVTTLISSPGQILSTIIFPSSAVGAVGPTIILVISQILASTISATFLSSVVALLYIDVRMRREGLDVELAAAANEV